MKSLTHVAFVWEALIRKILEHRGRRGPSSRLYANNPRSFFVLRDFEHEKDWQRAGEVNEEQGINCIKCGMPDAAVIREEIV